jgi:hypothetical protein
MFSDQRPPLALLAFYNESVWARVGMLPVQNKAIQHRHENCGRYSLLDLIQYMVKMKCSLSGHRTVIRKHLVAFVYLNIP